MRVPELYVRSDLSERFHENVESVVEYREKAEVLAELESFAGEEPEGRVDAIYDEDLCAWANAIRSYLQQKRVRCAAIVLLEQGTSLSLVKLWLAGLLGGFEMQQGGGFYDGAGVVASNGSAAA